MGSGIITTIRVLKAGIVNFFRNAWLSTAATAIMLVTLMILLSSLIANIALSAEITAIVEDITLSVYFHDEADENARTSLRNDLEANENVRIIRYVSKEEALQIFTEENAAQPELLDGLTISQNALPASFEVGVYDLKEISPVIAIAESDKYKEIVEETSYDEKREERIQRIASAQSFITQSSIVVGGIFAGISILIIFNTIRMAIFTRSEEIKIMKLIGANSSFIRGPFLFEASLYGIVASTISLGAVYGFLFSWGEEISRHLLEFPAATNFFYDNWIFIVFGVYGLSIGIGAGSSLLAMSRYMKSNS